MKKNVFAVSSFLLSDNRVENTVILENTKPAITCTKERLFCTCSTFFLRSSHYAKAFSLIVRKRDPDCFKT